MMRVISKSCPIQPYILITKSSSNLKILHVITLGELGGAQSVILNLATRALQDGHQMMVAASESGDIWKVLPDNVIKLPIPSLKRQISPLQDMKVILNLRKIYNEYKPDVIHLHSSKIGILGRIAFPTSKTIYTVHGFDSIRIAFRKFIHLEKALQKQSKNIVAVSKYDYHNLLSEGITSHVSYIYNGIPDFKLNITENKDTNFVQAKNRILSKKLFSVICIARLALPKRFDIFCEAAKMLQNEDIAFYWVGNKQPVDDLPSNVTCLGEIANAHQLLEFCNVSILPSDYEGMPMSILESLCYGIPVIASNVGGIAEILNGENGITLNNNASLFASAILKYKTDKELYNRTSLAARQSYNNNFTVNKMYDAYLELYKDIYQLPNQIRTL